MRLLERRQKSCVLVSQLSKALKQKLLRRSAGLKSNWLLRQQKPPRMHLKSRTFEDNSKSKRRLRPAQLGKLRLRTRRPWRRLEQHVKTSLRLL